MSKCLCLPPCAGLQIGYFLDRAGRDYIIFDKSTTAGNSLGSVE